MNIQKFAYLWEEKNKWFLDPVERTGGYLIVCQNEDKYVEVLEIEDDDLNEAVIQKMLAEGCKVLTREEANRMYREALPEGFSHDPETNHNVIRHLLEENQLPPSDEE